MFQEDITKIEDDNILTITSGQEDNSALADSPVKEVNSPDQAKKSWKDYFKIEKSKKD